jgi:5-methylcytosine-specific restriction enzyme A
MAWEGSTRSDRLPPDWPALRAFVLARDHYRCQVPGCGAPATDVDHIHRGDDHRPANLRAICSPCHRRKSAREGAAAAAARRRAGPKRARPPEAHPGLIES